MSAIHIMLVALLAGGAVNACQVVDGAAMQAFEAHAMEVTGQVTRIRDEQPWAVSKGERVPIQQLITTGDDGFARFAVAGGSGFDIFSHSRVIFRQNAASADDLLDVLAGRATIRLRPAPGRMQLRVLTPIASVVATQAATITIAVDEDDNVRLDVLEGEVKVQHLLLPRNEPTIVRAVDAILIQRDQQITRRLDRGSLYRYTIKPLHDLWTAVTPARGPRAGEPVEGNKLLAGPLLTPFSGERFR